MTQPDAFEFARTMPGFEFLSNLGRQSAASATGLGAGAGAVPGMPPMNHWIAPVFDPEELDKRIQDLRTVHFWLDQNTKALAATIQALELQKMTLLTLKSMNVSMQEMAEAFTVKPPAAQRQPEGSPAPSAGAAEAVPPAVDPMQWWSALTEQFQTIANEAVRDMSEHASRAAEQMAQSVQAGTEAMVSAQAAAAPASVEAAADATPRASDPPQNASAKPQKRRPPAPRAPRASS